ncbi:MAG: GNAT family N-acetyltransferase [Granulosicoccus sp.]
MTISLKLTDNVSHRDKASILNPLIDFNKAHVGTSDYRPLNVIIQDDAMQPAGGLWGHSAYGWFTIDLFFVPTSLRHQGLGTRIILTGESEAIARACHSAWVDTHEFQALEFYEKQGYELFAELPDYPSGHKRFFLKKALLIDS